MIRVLLLAGCLFAVAVKLDAAAVESLDQVGA